MIDQITTDPNLSTTLTSPSKVAFWRLVTFVVAVAINLLEQVIDIYIAVVESLVAKAAPGSAQWFQDKVLKFQYSASPTQAVVIDQTDFSIGYPIVNPALRIISRCAVVTTGNKTVSIKVAKSEPPTQLLSAEVTALQYYVAAHGSAGIKYSIINLPADLIGITATITYNGQYSNVISNSVKTAINDYLSKLPFNGIMRVSAIEDAIQNVTGVIDVVISMVTARPSTVAYPGTVVTSGAYIYQPMSGYLIAETTSGSTFDDTLTFIAG